MDKRGIDMTNCITKSKIDDANLENKDTDQEQIRYNIEFLIAYQNLTGMFN